MSESSIDIKIVELQAQIDKLTNEKKRLQALAPDRRLAEALHALMCNWNHTDGCGWFYEDKEEQWDRSGSTHNRWLVKARQIMKELPDMNVDDIVRIANILK